MAFSSVLVKKGVTADGMVFEEYTWDGAGVTTGDVTADVLTQPEMIKIERFFVSSNGDTAVVCAQDVAPNVLKLTFSNADTGCLRIEGKAA